jgi:hypothetical protein
MAEAVQQYPGWETWRFENINSNKSKKSSAIALRTGLERHFVPKRLLLGYQSLDPASALALFAFRSSDDDPSPVQQRSVGADYLSTFDQFELV